MPTVELTSTQDLTNLISIDQLTTNRPPITGYNHWSDQYSY